MTQAIESHGTLVKLGDGAGPPENFTTIAELGDIDLPEWGNEKEDVTVQQTPGRRRAYKTTLHKDMVVGFQINWDPADATHDGATGLKALADSGEAANFQIVLPDDDVTTFQFSAMVETFKPSAPVQGILRADVVLAIDGEVEDVTAGS